MDFFRLVELFFGPGEKTVGSELLGGLRSGVVDLPDHAITVSVHVDAQFNPLGFGDDM